MTFEKTELGRRAIQTREVKLTPCQRAVLITVNGAQNREALERSAAAMGGNGSDVDALIAHGLIAVVQTGSDAMSRQSVDSEPDIAIDFVGDEALRAFELPKGYNATADIAAASARQGAPTASGARAVTLESLWPVEEPVVADDWDVADGFSEAAEVSGRADFATVKTLALSLLQPLGLRAVQLRRTVEATNTAGQLRDVEPLIRALLTDAQKSQLDSAFIGLE